MEKRILPNEILLGEASALLAEGRDVELLIKGNSMMPYLINEKDSVVLRKLDTLEVGDVVLAQIAKGHYVMHRVWSIEGDTVTLMGDGNLCGKEQCRREDIVGTAVEYIKAGGKRKIPGKGRFWRRLLPIRRYLLFIYRRLLKLFKKI